MHLTKEDEDILFRLRITPRVKNWENLIGTKRADEVDAQISLAREKAKAHGQGVDFFACPWVY